MDNTANRNAPFPWAAGWIPPAPELPLHAAPCGARALELPTTAWSVGYRPTEIRTITLPVNVTVTVIGRCLATDAELFTAAAMTDVRNYAPLASFGGSYLSIVNHANETVVIGDLAGRTCVYHAAADDGHLWSTAATPLAAYLRAPRDLEVLALDLAVHGLELYGGHTPYQGVEAVPPGSLLRLTAGTANVERWHVLATDVREAPPFDAVAAPFALELFNSAARRAGKVPLITGDFSGGTGSGVLMHLASLFGEAIGITYADYPEAATQSSQIARQYQRLGHQVVLKDTETLHYNDLLTPGALPVTDLPSGDVPVLGPDRAILERAAELGSEHHLIGVGDDELLSARPSTLATLYRRGRRRTARRGARALARSQRSSARRAVGQVRELAYADYQHTMLRVANSILMGEVSATVEPDDWRLLAWATPTAAAGWLAPHTRRSVCTWLLRRGDVDPGYPNPEAREDWQQIRRGAADIHGYLTLAHQHRISVETPYYDTGLVKRALAVPGYARELPGQHKALVTVGLAKHLPAVLTESTGKDPHNVLRTDQDGLLTNAAELRKLAADSILVDAGVLERQPLQRYVDRTIDGVDASHRSLTRWVSQELWLRDSDPRRETWWEEALCTRLPRSRSRPPTTASGCWPGCRSVPRAPTCSSPAPRSCCSGNGWRAARTWPTRCGPSPATTRLTRTPCSPTWARPSACCTSAAF